MAITNISRDQAQNPSIVRIITTDNFADITANEYITGQQPFILQLNKGRFTWLDSDLVAIKYDDGEDFFTRDAVNNTFVLDQVPSDSANRELDNLQNTSVNADIIPDAGSTRDLGSNDNPWAVVYTDSIGDGAEATTQDPNNNSQLIATTAYVDNAVSGGGILESSSEFSFISNIYATPVLVVPAPPSGHVTTVLAAYIYPATASTVTLTDGGGVALQYGSDANLGGTVITEEISETIMQGIIGNFDGLIRAPVALSVYPESIIGGVDANSGIYLSNDTSAFDSGINSYFIRAQVFYILTPLP